MFSEGGGVDIFYFLVKDLKKKPLKNIQLLIKRIQGVCDFPWRMQ